MKLKSVATTALALATTIAALAGSTSAGAGSIDPPATQSLTPTQQLTPTAAAQPVRGDFDGDGRDDIFWYVPGSGTDFLWSGKGRDTASPVATPDRFDVSTLSISGTYTPIVGDFDGDSRDDIFWYGPGSAADSIWYFTGRGTVASKNITISGRYTPTAGNFDTAGPELGQNDDIFFYSATGTGSTLWSGTHTRTFTSRSYTISPPANARVHPGNWRQTPTTAGAAVHQDLLFYVPGTGTDLIWTGDGTGAFTPSAVTINGRYNLIIGEFDSTTGPEMTDIFWYAPGTAKDAVWMNNGSGFTSIAQVVNGKSYKPVVLEARTASAQDDILWNNPIGADFIWRLQGFNRAFAYTSFTPGSFGGGEVGTRSPIVGDFDFKAPTSGATTGVLTSGFEHSCAVTTAGGVKCWGGDDDNQLGNGTAGPSSTPVDVTGLTSGVATVASAPWGFHTCAVTTSGGVRCWGLNSTGQLGNGTTAPSTTAVAVPSLTSGITAVATTNGSSCALTTAGGVKCWGRNAEGQLGRGNTAGSLTPVDVTGLTSGVTAISGGYKHMCALTTAGGAKCWGLNSTGQVGNGTTVDATTPTDVTGLTSGVASIVVGDRTTCAVTTTGAARCWGWNAFGQVGNGTTVNATTPVNVTGLSSGVASIAPGSQHTCALSNSGDVKCWGGNADGQVGNGTNNSAPTPVDVSGLPSGVSSITAGTWHSCALTSSGAVTCWGGNFSGQLGRGTTTDANTPGTVSGGAVYTVAEVPGNDPNIDVLWWAKGNLASQTELMWLELENIE